MTNIVLEMNGRWSEISRSDNCKKKLSSEKDFSHQMWMEYFNWKNKIKRPVEINVCIIIRIPYVRQEYNDVIEELYIFTQPLRLGRIWHKVNF